MDPVVALIPARAGSKGVPGKNIIDVAGHPLLAWSVMAARLAQSVDRVLLSTDSGEYAESGSTYGAEVPFLRPSDLATDGAVDRGFMLHAMEWLEANEGACPRWWVLLRPTTPLRDPAVIDRAVQQMRSANKAQGLRSAHACPESPFKWFRINQSGHYTGLISDSTAVDAYNGPRQGYEQVYLPNGYVDVICRDTARNRSGLFGDPVAAFITQPVLEVDTEIELSLIRQQAAGHPLKAELDALT